LRPEELGFLRYLKEARVPVNEYEFSWNKIADIQLQVRIICNVNVNVNGNISVSIIFTNNINADFMLFFQLEKLISKNYYLCMSAKEAFKNYVRAYDSHHLKQVFDIETLDLAKVSKSFGFTVPPAMDLSKLFRRDP